MKWAVEAKIFNGGKIVAKIRPAKDGEVEGCTETRTCDIWVDIFGEKGEAEKFCRDYRKA